MKFETEHSIGDTVYGVQDYRKYYLVDCPSCGGAGEIVLADGEKTTCPKCAGRSTKKMYEPTRWHITGAMTVGLVRAIQQYDGADSSEEEYMCHETGVGSGRVWRDGLLFPDKGAAAAECERRNAKEDVAASVP